MRVTTSNRQDATVTQLQRRQQEMADAQLRLISGKRVLRPSDDPAGAAVIERSLAATTNSDAQIRANDTARTTMQLAESALGNATELMQQMRELVMNAGDGSFTDAERKTLSDQLRGLRNDLLAVTNRSDGQGRFLFGGQGSDTKPLLDTPTGVVFTGIGGMMKAATNEAMPLSFDGRAVWLQAPDPDAPGTYVNIFSVLDTAINNLGTAGGGGVPVEDTVTDALKGIDASMANISSWRSAAGEVLNRADSIGSRLTQAKLDAQTARSNTEDLDMIAAISDFQTKNTGYDAALKTYSSVQRMSLFDYIK